MTARIEALDTTTRRLCREYITAAKSHRLDQSSTSLERLSQSWRPLVACCGGLDAAMEAIRLYEQELIDQ